MALRQLVMLALQVSILSTVFGFGLKAVPADIIALLRRPALLCRSLVAVLVVMPILAVALVRLFNFKPTAEIALLALAISPLPPLLPRKESKGGGDRNYGLALMVIVAVLAIVTVPLLAEALERVFGRPLGVAPAAIARIVVVAVLLPLAAGMTVRRLTPAVAERIAPVAASVTTLLMPLAIGALLLGTWRAIWIARGDGAIVAIVLFVVFGLLIGHILGGPKPDQSVVLALSTAGRHPAIALSIASANFPDEHFASTVLLYLIVMTVVGMPYLAWQRRRTQQT